MSYLIVTKSSRPFSKSVLSWEPRSPSGTLRSSRKSPLSFIIERNPSAEMSTNYHTKIKNRLSQSKLLVFIGYSEILSLDNRYIHVVSGWANIFKFLPIEDINSNHVNLGVTMFTSLRSRHFNNLARPSLFYNRGYKGFYFNTWTLIPSTWQNRSCEGLSIAWERWRRHQSLQIQTECLQALPFSSWCGNGYLVNLKKNATDVNVLQLKNCLMLHNQEETIRI